MKDYNHTFLLYTDSGNQTFVFSGFPETDLLINPYQSFALDNGQFMTSYGQLNDQQYDSYFINEDIASYVTLATGADLGKTAKVISKVSNLINNLDVDYGEFTRNSNSAVSTAILHAGLQIPNYYWIETDPTGNNPGLDPVDLRAPGLGENLAPQTMESLLSRAPAW